MDNQESVSVSSDGSTRYRNEVGEGKRVKTTIANELVFRRRPVGDAVAQVDDFVIHTLTQACVSVETREYCYAMQTHCQNFTRAFLSDESSPTSVATTSSILINHVSAVIC